MPGVNQLSFTSHRILRTANTAQHQKEMAVLGRLVRTASAGRTINASKITIPSLAPSRNLLRPSFQRSFEHQIHSSRSEMQRLLSAPNFSDKYFLFPAVLVGLFGGAMLDIAYADADEAAAKPPLPSASPSSYEHLVEIAHKERKRVEDSLRSRGVKHGSYPQFNVAVKGQKVTIKFQVPTTCEIPQLIANLVSHLGVKVEERSGGSHMALRAWDNAVAWQLALTYPKPWKEIGVDQGHQGDLDTNEGDLCILIFRPLISSDKAEIEFMKTGGFSPKEIDALVSILQFSGAKLNKAVERKPREGSSRIPNAEKSASNLEAMGVKIYGLDEPHGSSMNSDISWDNIAGYDQQKREIEDTILLSLQSPEVYDDIVRGTRRKFESNRPRAILFEGPPGTGKTSSARVIANQSGFPLLYVPLEVVLSKYYGESERLLGKVFSLANELPNGAIIFLDEVDSFAVARDSEMHEATRRILSVLLRQIDGFEQDKKVVVIAATNRKQDLDPALISRFDSMITFGLPDQQNRQEIVAQYAKHLTKSELEDFANITEHMSGRDIRDICQQAERSWAAKIIRGRANQTGEQRSLPPLQEYIESAIKRRNALLGIEEQRILESKYRTRKAPLDLA